MEDDADDSQFLAARMVNAHAFCPRLCWLEVVARVDEQNEHVAQGLETHRRVDHPGGKLTAPPKEVAPACGDDEPKPWHARSLWLSSPTLGVTARLDLVEADGDAVIPVDIKKGSANEDGLWAPDAIQLTLQALLLREAGYTVHEVGAYYAEERRKVMVPLTDTMCDRAREEVARAKATLAQGAPPLPLVDSPQCKGCSVHPVCLPDETNALLRRGTAEHGIKRVVPPNDELVPLYVSDHSARLGVSSGSLKVSFHNEVKPPVTVPLHQLHSVTVVGNAQATTQALHACMDAGVTVHWMTGGGWHLGRLHGDGAALLHVRKAQFAHAEGARGHEIARVLVADKIANVRTLLRRNDDDPKEEVTIRLKELAEKALVAGDRTALMALEAEAARKSWAEYSRLLGGKDEAFAMNGRTRRPPRDRTNAMLGFVYGLLVKDCVQAVVGAGLDAFEGVYHVPLSGRPSLALDLMEPFRPLVADSVVLSLVRRGEVEPRGFVDTGQAVTMALHTRKAVIAAYERRVAEEIAHPLFGYRLTYRQVLAVQARLLGRALTGEVPTMASFRTR